MSISEWGWLLQLPLSPTPSSDVLPSFLLHEVKRSPSFEFLPRSRVIDLYCLDYFQGRMKFGPHTPSSVHMGFDSSLNVDRTTHVVVVILKSKYVDASTRHMCHNMYVMSCR